MANPTLLKTSLSDESVKNEKADKNMSINNLIEDVFRQKKLIILTTLNFLKNFRITGSVATVTNNQRRRDSLMPGNSSYDYTKRRKTVAFNETPEVNNFIYNHQESQYPSNRSITTSTW